MEQVAIKFFAKKNEYEEEAEVYRNSPLRFFMPTVQKYVDNADSSVEDPFGAALPPFIVMEKGESLQDRARRTRIDVYTAAQVCITTILCGRICSIRYPNNSPNKFRNLPSEGTCL